TGPGHQYEMNRSSDVRWARETSRSTCRTVKSSTLRKSKSRTLVMRTWSPSTAARERTATSARHGRSFDGGIAAYQTTTAAKSPTNPQPTGRRRVSHNAKTLTPANTTASARRDHAQDRLE